MCAKKYLVSEKKRMRISLLYIAMFLFLNFNAEAKDFGVIGEVYAIHEKDFLEFIYERLEKIKKSGGLESINRKIMVDIKDHILRPKRQFALGRAKKYRAWFFDPSIKINNDIKGLNGDVIVEAMKIINPLAFVSLKKQLIFYDADDANQVAWAIKRNNFLKGNSKLILNNGSILKQQKIFHKNIFFDQKGLLIKKFAIKNLPATVTQKGLRLMIEEHLL